jgi:hypothetical protein
MRLLASRAFVALCAALCAAQQPTGDPPLKISPVKTTVNIEGRPVEITASGAVSPFRSNPFLLTVNVDLADFQANITPILAAQFNRSDRCGELLSLDRGHPYARRACRHPYRLCALLPPELETALSIHSVHFENAGGAGRLWLIVGGELRLSAEQLRAAAQRMAAANGAK